MLQQDTAEVGGAVWPARVQLVPIGQRKAGNVHDDTEGHEVAADVNVSESHRGRGMQDCHMQIKHSLCGCDVRSVRCP